MWVKWGFFVLLLTFFRFRATCVVKDFLCLCLSGVSVFLSEEFFSGGYFSTFSGPVHSVISTGHSPFGP